MSLRDQIKIVSPRSFLPDYYEDFLFKKLITQHRWSESFYKKDKTNVMFLNPATRKFLYPLYELICSEVSKLDKDIEFLPHDELYHWTHILINNKDRETVVWHDHQFSNPDVNFDDSKLRRIPKWSTVFYLKVPEGSGHIKFRNKIEKVKIYPQEGQLFIFSAGLLHTPKPSKCEELRISINVNLCEANVWYRGKERCENL